MLAPAAQTAIENRALASFRPGRAMRGPVLRTLEAAANPLADRLSLIGTTMSYPRNSEIFGEGEPAEFVYKILSGCVRTYKVLSDGRRQIDGFYLPGDVFGLAVGDDHTMSAEALSDAKVVACKRSALNARAQRDPAAARALFALTGHELRRVQDRLLLLIKTAQERVAGFLLEMADRVGDGNDFDLPMSRQDIADYLGLTIETVSRTLSAMESSALIDVPNARRIVLRNRAHLCQLIG